ncbi:MAG: bifunctional phosphoribosyl-AMP cyclohydrolase/phosphoribosyl-ATP diphosphatase HisIE [Acidobacteriota bacterium]|nr:bifunctional phosphoribosyl-AMP cyclohydrolase/phosphoribosyl-ATP diphosphatase HisIE [Acidobacteriota bacterium]
MEVDFAKFTDDLAPAIVQDFATGRVLMLGYMNREAFEKTRTENRVTFFSRSRQRLWTKGETSGNFLFVKEILLDCDCDAILIKAIPAGTVCHTGAETCFNEKNAASDFLFELEKTIWQRKNQMPEESYTAKLFSKGAKKISQKLGEEAVELVIEAQGERDDLFLNEAADLTYHLLVLLASRNFTLADISKILSERSR